MTFLNYIEQIIDNLEGQVQEYKKMVEQLKQQIEKKDINKPK